MSHLASEYEKETGKSCEVQIEDRNYPGRYDSYFTDGYVEWLEAKESLKSSHNKQSVKNNNWFCSRCKKDVEGVDVTFEETHVGCGGNCH